MPKAKVTITLDRAKAEEARSLTGAATTSAVIDLALRELIRSERIRHDVEAYERMPLTAEELAMATAMQPPVDDDDTDWDALYPEAR
jgi:hypothetical protein